MLQCVGQVFIGENDKFIFSKYGFPHDVPNWGSNLTPAKLFFEHLQMKHLSIDINGQNGAISLDARQDLTTFIRGKFNLITNLGFSEHVGEQDLEENLWKNQYTMWKNLHDFGLNGTVYYNLLPRIGHWDKHGVCGYDKEFFLSLIEKNMYNTIIAPTYIDKRHYADPKNNILIAYEKTNNKEFMTLEQFLELPGIFSKYDEYNIREATLNFPNGHKSTVVVDVRDPTWQDTITTFCIEEYINNAESVGFENNDNELVEQVELCNDVLQKVIQDQRIDGRKDV